MCAECLIHISYFFLLFWLKQSHEANKNIIYTRRIKCPLLPSDSGGKCVHSGDRMKREWIKSMIQKKLFLSYLFQNFQFSKKKVNFLYLKQITTCGFLSLTFSSKFIVIYDFVPQIKAEKINVKIILE